MNFLIPAIVAFCLVGIYLLIVITKGDNKKHLTDLPEDQRGFAVSKYYLPDNKLSGKTFDDIINSPDFLDGFEEWKSNRV